MNSVIDLMGFLSGAFLSRDIYFGEKLIML